MKRYCKHCAKEVEAVRSRVENTEICPTCGTSFITGSFLSPGTIVSGFQVEAEVGRGGMGVVYKAKQLNLERHVALKILSDEYAQDIDFVERFFKEARAAASLSHPNIVQAYDAGSTPEGIYYFAMELIEGETLENRIVREGRLPLKSALDIALKIAEALAYAWDRQKLSHGDIKPENIILDSSGGAKLADLGLAKSLHEEHAGGELLATPLYAPPELIKGEVDKIGFRSDLYSFGATLYHMLAGNPPFPGDDPDVVFKRHLEESPKALLELAHGTPSSLSDFVGQLLSKKPEERPASWKDVVVALERIRDGDHKVFQKAPSRHASPDHHSEAASPSVGIGGKFIRYVVLVLFLAAAFMGIYFLGMRRGGGGTEEGTDSQAEWDKLRPKLQYMASAKALEETGIFLAKYKDSAPEAAVKYFEQLKSKIDVKQKERATQENLKAEFKTELEVLLAASAPANWQKKPPAELQSLSKRILALIKKLQENESLLAPFCPEGTRANLKNSAAKMDELAQKILKEAEEKRREELARQENERKEQARKEREAAEAKQKAHMIQNAMVDDYYMMLSDYLVATDKPQAILALQSAINTWIAKHSYPPAELSGRTGFLKKQLSSQPQILAVFTAHEKFLKGAMLPDKLADGFVVDDFDDTSVKLMQQDGKAKLGKKIKWSQLTPENWASLVTEKILKPERMNELTGNEHNTVLLYLFLNAPFAQVLASQPLFGKIPPSDMALWDAILKDLKLSENERKCINAWQNVNASLQKKDFNNAALAFRDIVSLPPGPFHSRYAEDIKLVEAQLKVYSPATQALELMSASELALKGSDALAAMDMLMTLSGRFGGVVALDKNLRDGIASLKKTAIEKMQQACQVKTIQDNRVPFYYWDYETPGEAWVYAQIVQKEVFNKGRHPILPFLHLAGQLHMGDWTGAEEAVSSLGTNYQVLMNATGPLRNWSSSLLFGLGLGAIQYGAPELQIKIEEDLFVLAGGSENNVLKALSTALAMEYALMIRQPDAVIDAAQKYSFTRMEDGFKPHARIALLHILASIQKQDLNLQALAGKLSEYEHLFSKDPELKADFNWAKLAVSILKKEERKDAYQILKQRCHAQDICSRLLLSALSRAFCDGNAPDPSLVEAIIQSIGSRVSDNTVSGELWFSLFVFKFTRAYDPTGQQMHDELNKALKECRICSLSCYPRLLLSSSALALMRNDYDQGTVSSMYSLFATGAPLIADRDAAAASLLLKVLGKEDTEELFAGRAPSLAVWQGIMRILAQGKTPSAKTTIKAIKGYLPVFTWEERYLLRILEYYQK